MEIYVKEGFIQECRSRIIFPEFDKSKLLSDIRDSKIEKIIE